MSPSCRLPLCPPSPSGPSCSSESQGKKGMTTSRKQQWTSRDLSMSRGCREGHHTQFPVLHQRPLATPEVEGTNSGSCRNSLDLLDLLPGPAGQMQDPEVFVVIELLPIWRSKFPTEQPELSATLSNNHSLPDKRERGQRLSPF